jgi:uncharacterized protein (TIGR00725 family)
VVCGGLSGVMEAAARGATEEGGVAIGVLPDEDRGRVNLYLSYSVATGTGQARNLAVVCSGTWSSLSAVSMGRFRRSGWP